VAYLARHLEARYQGVPQDIEWTYDGETLWLLQSRPITTLQPLWTRKIAAEVIPGAIRPLTWSINRPLTCGVWGEIFTVVLGNQRPGPGLHRNRHPAPRLRLLQCHPAGGYLPAHGPARREPRVSDPGAKFSRPPLSTTLKALPGLLRLLNRERRLWVDFERENATLFTAGLNALTMVRRETLSPVELLDRIEDVLVLLRHVTYYNIMAPLSFALRRAVLGVAEEALDARQNAEVAAVEDLRSLAAETRQIFSAAQLKTITNGSSLMTALAETPDGEMILAQLNHFIEEYGYLSPVGTDIAVATWHENPAPVRELLAQFVLHPPPPKPTPETPKNGKSGGPLLELAQRRFDLKGQVNTLYNRLLAELRWSILALERQWT
jgi:hypothetical protein